MADADGPTTLYGKFKLKLQYILDYGKLKFLVTFQYELTFLAFQFR